MAAGVANPIKLVRDFFDLPLSQRRSLAERYGVIKSDPTEPDLERDKRTIMAVADQGKQIEFALLVDAAKSKYEHRMLARQETLLICPRCKQRVLDRRSYGESAIYQS